MMKVKVKKPNKLLTKKAKNEFEFWFNWLGMDESDREVYISRLIPLIKRSLIEDNKLPLSLRGMGTAALLNNYFQDLEIAIKQKEHLTPQQDREKYKANLKVKK